MGLLTTIGAHGFGRFAYSMINPSMIDGLGLSYTEVGNLATGNFVVYLVLAIVGGFLAARLGPRIVISLSLALMGITMILTGLAKTYGFALAMRTLTGLGNGGAFVPAMALGSIWFSPQCDAAAKKKSHRHAAVSDDLDDLRNHVRLSAHS